MIGIDFGTTTTEVALCPTGTPELIEDPEGDRVVPSAMAFTPTGKRLFGSKAAARRLIDPANTLHSVKRIIGLRWFDQTVANFREHHAFEMKSGTDGLPRFVTRGGELTAGDVARDIFGWVKTWPGMPKSAPVVVTAPPSFEEAQRLAVADAARAAGFDRVTVIDEPYAALLPYLHERVPERTVAVYDLGGGTFDVAVMKVRGLSHEVLAAGGDAYLGGDDLDRALADWAAAEVLQSHRWDLKESPESWKNLLVACQQVKKRLSLTESSRIALTLVDPVLAGKEIVVSREQLDTAIHELVQGTFAMCDDVLLQAGLTAQAVDQVIIAGGSTYLPSIRDAVGRYFGRKPTADLQPDHLVALGASIWGALQTGDSASVRPGAE